MPLLKQLRQVLTLNLVGCLASISLQAAAATSPAAGNSSSTKPPTSEQTEQQPAVGSVVNRGDSPMTMAATGAASVTKPSPPALPADVQVLVDKIQKEREDFLKKELELKKQLQDATATDREKIRDAMQATRDQWLQQEKALRTELRDRVKELKDKLKDNRDRQLDDAKAKTPGNRGR